MHWEIILLEAVVVGSESIHSGIALPAGNLWQYKKIDPSHCSEYSSMKQPHTPSMLISIHSPLTRRLSLSYSYVRSPPLQVNLSMICLSYANVCWNANHIIIVLVLMLVSIHSLLLSLPPSSSFSSIYSNHNSPSLIFFFPPFPLYLPI